MLDFTVDLRQGFFAAHRQHRVPKADEDRNQRNHVRPLIAIEPAERAFVELHIPGMRPRRKVPIGPGVKSVETPSDEYHHHHGGELHDAKGFPARFGNALDVLPPEIEGDGDSHGRGGRIDVEMQRDVRVGEQLVEHADEILACRNAADRAGEDVIKHQRRNGELREGSSQRFFHHAVHTAAHEHAAALDVHGSHRIRKQHDAENEPGSGLADELLGFTACVIGGGSEVVEDDRCGAPERDERQHGRSGHEDFGYGAGSTRRECVTRGV